MKQKPDFRVPRQIPGESDEAHYRRVRAWINGEDVRTKTDLRGWTGSPPFHLDTVPFGYRMSKECAADLDLIDRYSTLYRKLR